MLTPCTWVTSAVPAKPTPQPASCGPPAQVHVLVVHEVGLVEAAELLQRAAPGQEARARHPAGPGHHVAFGGAGVVAQGERVLRVEQRQQRVPGGVGEGGEVAHRGIDLARLGEDARPHQRPGGLGLEGLAQRGQRAGVHDEVRVADEDPLGRGRLARQGGQAPVDPGAEADVAAGPHDAHGRASRPAREVLQRGWRRSRRRRSPPRRRASPRRRAGSGRSLRATVRRRGRPRRRRSWPDTRCSVLPGEAELDQRPQRAEAVAPGDLLPLVVLAAGVGDRAPRKCGGRAAAPWP